MTLNLQSHEAVLLKAVQDGRERTLDELALLLKYDQSALVRASLTLQKEKLADMIEKETFIAKLTKEGEEALRSGLPERRLVQQIIKIGPEAKLEFIKFDGKNVAIGYAKRKGYIDLDNTNKGIIVKITKKGTEAAGEPSPEELLLKRAVTTQKVTREELELLKSRRLIEYGSRIIRSVKATPKGMEVARLIKIDKEVSRLTPELIKSGEWKNARLRRYNVAAAVKPVYPGKRHFMNQAREYARKLWLELGFREMTGPIFQTSFWNFDALFIPQDHPARDMQDTFFLNAAPGELPAKRLVDSVRKMHESGDDQSSGWGYKWSEPIARKVVLRTHTTALSARTLAALKESDLPAKYFSLGSVFRNETMDWKHLFEFDQSEGIVIDENANFRHLIGYLKEFYRKMGYDRVRLRPAYFPYTEMSTEIEVFHPVKKVWIELGGAGIFRPEVVKPLLGRDIPVLAWGLGFGRILSEYYKITDIRDLYKNDVKQLRESRQWMRG
ncbi:MAG: phenylalanine--tRNA ligase subunit alpha [archaeon]